MIPKQKIIRSTQVSTKGNDKVPSEHHNVYVKGVLRPVFERPASKALQPTARRDPRLP